MKALLKCMPSLLNGIRSLKTFYIFILPALMLFMISCNKEQLVPPANIENNEIQKSSISQTSQTANVGATQISGIGYFDEVGECNSSLGQGSDFALIMTGDLAGCLYVFIDEYECSPSGTYREQGRELFVGMYNGQYGTFRTTYKFHAKYEGCSEGFPVGAEIFGRCQHPIVKGSGTGVFSGVTGRLDFKDDIEAGNFPYRGHLKF